MKPSTLFVYYKIQQNQHAALTALLPQFRNELNRLDPELSLELMQRPEVSSDGFETWMEVYRHPQGVSSSIVEQIHQIAIKNGLPPNRQNEIFIPLE